ncbi:MAG: mechanosensitive ion channel domain-containing protein [Myxococcota bacterium]|nr:mechanosensitive ion channel domain-containing protein [Myxococcota bacterium]
MRRAVLSCMFCLLVLAPLAIAQIPESPAPPGPGASGPSVVVEPPVNIGHAIQDEMVEAVSTSQLVGLAVKLLLLFLFLRLGDGLAGWSLRNRPDLGALLSGWMPPLRLGMAALAFLMVLDILIPEHPTARAVVVVLLVLFVFWAGREVLQNVAAGAVLIARRAVRVGEYLRVGDDAGRVVSVSLRGVELQADDGSRIFVPGRRLQTEVATHAPGGGRAAPVTVTCPIPGEGSVPADRVQRLCRRLVILSPRRVPQSPVLVHVDGDVSHVTLTATPFDSAEAGALEAELTRRVRETFAPVVPLDEIPETREPNPED